MSKEILEGAATAVFVGSGLIWAQTGVDPPLCIARAAIMLRCGFIYLVPRMLRLLRETPRETMRLYRAEAAKMLVQTEEA